MVRHAGAALMVATVIYSGCTTLDTQMPGVVVAEDGTPIAGAAVTLNGNSTPLITDSQGMFHIETTGWVSPAVLVVHAPGYAMGATHLFVLPQKLQVTLRKLDTVMHVTLPSVGEAPLYVEAMRNGGTAQLAIRAASLVDPRGALATGDVNITMAYWDGTEHMESSPGPLTAHSDGTAYRLGPMRSLGMVDIEIRQGNDVLQIAPGQSLPFTVQVPALYHTVLANAHIQAMAGLFWLDPNDALWQRVYQIGQGGMAYDATQGIFTGNLPHLSAWNYDLMGTNSSCVQGTVENCGGTAYANNSVRAWFMTFEGLYYQDYPTDASGHFCANVLLPASNYATNWQIPVHISGTDGPQDSSINPNVVSQDCAKCAEEGMNPFGYPNYCHCDDTYCPVECKWGGPSGALNVPADDPWDTWDYTGVVADATVQFIQGVNCGGACFTMPTVKVGCAPGCGGANAKHLGDACDTGDICCSPDGSAVLECSDFLCVPPADPDGQ